MAANFTRVVVRRSLPVAMLQDAADCDIPDVSPKSGMNEVTSGGGRVQIARCRLALAPDCLNATKSPFRRLARIMTRRGPRRSSSFTHARECDQSNVFTFCLPSCRNACCVPVSRVHSFCPHGPLAFLPLRRATSFVGALYRSTRQSEHACERARGCLLRKKGLRGTACRTGRKGFRWTKSA